MTGNFLVLFLALLLDRIIGDPDTLWRKYPHPVVLFGKAIDVADRALNNPALEGSARKRNGVIALVILLAASLLAGAALHWLFALLGPVGMLPEAVLASVFLAQKSLSDHVKAVADGLRRDGITGGRKAVSMIVGRDPDVLDEPAVCRAAIESLSENFSDGVVAPVFWFALFGLPGLFAYKMLNTADSMIGHKSDKYLQFGWASARLDDVANWIPARLSIFLVAAGACWSHGRGAGRNALIVAMRDSGLHRSPNSGWPEAAMAGALDIQLTGPRIYGGVKVSEPMINGAGRADISAAEVEGALSVYAATCNVLALICAMLVLIAAS